MVEALFAFATALRESIVSSETDSLKSILVTQHSIGVFFAPAILFFAITGGLQMSGLHDTSRGSSYVPPAFLVHLSQLQVHRAVYVLEVRAAEGSRLRRVPRGNRLSFDLAATVKVEVCWRIGRELTLMEPVFLNIAPKMTEKGETGSRIEK